MAISGGDDRSQLRPLRPDGNVDHDEAGHFIAGNHKGDFACFNVRDPAHGTVHQYGTKRDILGARQRGWWVADPHTDGASCGDVEGLYPDYIHLVTTEENYRRLVDEQLERNRQQLAPGGLGFLENVSREEYETGRSDRGHLATRFATRDHGTFVYEGDRVVENLTPRGILREEDF